MMRPSVMTIGKRERPERRRKPLLWTIGLAALSWALVFLAGYALAAWLA